MPTCRDDASVEVMHWQSFCNAKEISVVLEWSKATQVATISSKSWRNGIEIRKGEKRETYFFTLISRMFWRGVRGGVYRVK